MLLRRLKKLPPADWYRHDWEETLKRRAGILEVAYRESEKVTLRAGAERREKGHSDPGDEGDGDGDARQSPTRPVDGAWGV